MSEEEKKDNIYKISVPIITNQELEELNYNIQSNYESIVKEISKTVSKDKDIIVLKQVIEYQDKLIEKQEKEIEELKADNLAYFEYQQMRKGNKV